tara:strand:+ start:570 stop:866 length:297 start_codon:yes stop_codon:yes gene_type:complete
MEMEMIEKHHEPDPQWEAAIRGDTEALFLELEYIARLVDKISQKAEVLQRTIHDLRRGLEQHSTSNKYDEPTTKELRSGSLRVSTDIRDKRNNPPTTQ